MSPLGALSSQLFQQFSNPINSLLALVVAALVVERFLSGRIDIDTGGPRRNNQWTDEWKLPFLVLIVIVTSWIASSVLLVVVDRLAGVTIWNKVGSIGLFAWVYGRHRTEENPIPGTREAQVVLAIIVLLTFHQAFLMLGEFLWNEITRRITEVLPFI